jgi:hypothetical protein
VPPHQGNIGTSPSVTKDQMSGRGRGGTAAA